MRNRDYFLPSITTLILTGMIWFLSCAHQNRAVEDDDIAFEQAATESAQSEPAESSDWSSSPEPVASASEPKSENPSEPAPVEPTPPVAAPEEPSLAKNSSEPVAEPVVETPPATAEPELESSEELVEEVPPPKIRKSFSLITPAVPRNAIKKNGSSLNRFYFARKGDNPKKVSLLIYSNSKLATKLARWNGKVWSPGQLIFYSSPVNPTDNRMMSFYQERDLRPEEYQVRGGDWLTRIALKNLGHVRSWKELAVVNGLKSPNSLEVGQTLAIYPRNLFETERTAVPQQAKADYERAQPAPKAESQEPILAKPSFPEPPMENKIAEPSPTVAPMPPLDSPPAGTMPEIKEPDLTAELSPSEETPTTEMNWNQLVEQNSIAILIGAALVVLLLALAARKKRLKARAASSESSDSDGLTENTPSKFRRR